MAESRHVRLTPYDPELPFAYRETADHATGSAGAGLIVKTRDPK